jgi:hypothetical protein
MEFDAPILLSVEDGQTVFQALSELPFKYVFELIGKLNHTTNETPPVNRGGKACYEYALLTQEIELIIQALGQMPYQRVQGIITQLETMNKERIPNE